MSGFHGSKTGRWQPGSDEILAGIGGRLATALPVAFQEGEGGREGAIQIAWIDLISLYTPTCNVLLSQLSHKGRDQCLEDAFFLPF